MFYLIIYALLIFLLAFIRNAYYFGFVLAITPAFF